MKLLTNCKNILQNNDSDRIGVAAKEQYANYSHL